MSSPNGGAPGNGGSGGNGNATVGNVHKSSTANRLPAKSVTPTSVLKRTAPIRLPKSQRRGGK